MAKAKTVSKDRSVTTGSKGKGRKKPVAPKATSKPKPATKPCADSQASKIATSKPKPASATAAMGSRSKGKRMMVSAKWWAGLTEDQQEHVRQHLHNHTVNDFKRLFTAIDKFIRHTPYTHSFYSTFNVIERSPDGTFWKHDPLEGQPYRFIQVTIG